MSSTAFTDPTHAGHGNTLDPDDFLNFDGNLYPDVPMPAWCNASLNILPSVPAYGLDWTTEHLDDETPMVGIMVPRDLEGPYRREERHAALLGSVPPATYKEPTSNHFQVDIKSFPRGHPVFVDYEESPLQHVGPAEVSMWETISGPTTAARPRSIRELGGKGLLERSIERPDSARSLLPKSQVSGSTSRPRQSVKGRRATVQDSPEQIARLTYATSSPLSSFSRPPKRGAPLRTPSSRKVPASNPASNSPFPLDSDVANLSVFGYRETPQRSAALNCKVTLANTAQTSPRGSRDR